MAKGAANESALGGLHSTLATLLGKTLSKNMTDLAVLDMFKDFDWSTADPEDPDVQAMVLALSQIREPNPAHLSVVAKFLKDNEIGMDSEQVDELSSLERRLQDNKARRGKLRLVDIPQAQEA